MSTNNVQRELRLVQRLAFRAFSLASRCSTRQEVPFSQTPAFSPRKSSGYSAEFSSSKPLYIPDYYDSTRFKLIRLFSAMGSLAAVIFYSAFIRERSDVDDILEAPPNLMIANLQRAAIRSQINDARSSGKNAAVLEAELDYADVREAALRNKWQNAEAAVEKQAA